MELFRIDCVTCQAELSVRNESIIGTIIACPRCGSMVEVSQPAPQEVDADCPSPELDLPVPELSAGSSFLTWALCATAVGLTLIAGLTWWLTSADGPQSVAVAEPFMPTPVVEEAPFEETHTQQVTPAEEPVADQRRPRSLIQCRNPLLKNLSTRA